MFTKTIIHLDDHRLLVSGIKQLIESEFNVEYLPYQSPIVALKDIEERMANKLPIDLILTDYNHVGITGCQFAREIRKVEVAMSTRIPVFMLTMMPETHADIAKAIQDRTVDAYFQKDVDPLTFLNAIKKRLFV